jgi:branched-chain amino acid transport system permease protein
MPAAAAASPHAWLQAQARWNGIEIAFWVATLLPFWLFPDYLVLASQIAITALFALSLDLILGYAGIVSLGHAAFFGLGAYTAGLAAKYGWGEPITGLILGALAAGIVGYAASFIIARFRHLALIMITLGMGLLLTELANSMHWLTGGTDGLQGVKMWPIFNKFRFDLYGLHRPTAIRSSCCFCLFSSRGASSVRRSACRCAASARTRCACRRSAHRAARTCARSIRSPP